MNAGHPTRLSKAGTDFGIQLVLLRGYFSAGKERIFCREWFCCRSRGAAAETWDYMVLGL